DPYPLSSLSVVLRLGCGRSGVDESDVDGHPARECAELSVDRLVVRGCAEVLGEQRRVQALDERAQSDHRLEQRRPARLRGGRRVGGAERDARAGPLDAHPPRRMPGSPRLPGTHEADRSGDPFEDVIAVVPGWGAAGQIGDAEAALDGFDVTVAE